MEEYTMIVVLVGLILSVLMIIWRWSDIVTEAIREIAFLAQFTATDLDDQFIEDMETIGLEEALLAMLLTLAERTDSKLDDEAVKFIKERYLV